MMKRLLKLVPGFFLLISRFSSSILTEVLVYLFRLSVLKDLTESEN